MDKLKPCPFCGGEAIIDEISPHKHVIATFMPDCEGECFIECTKCGCMIGANGANAREKVIEHWNRRADNETD